MKGIREAIVVEKYDMTDAPQCLRLEGEMVTEIHYNTMEEATKWGKWISPDFGSRNNLQQKSRHHITLFPRRAYHCLGVDKNGWQIK